MLEKASLAGNMESTFVLGMLMLAEGRGRQQQALQLLTDAYPISLARSQIIPALIKKVRDLLSWDGRREIRFHGCYLKFPVYKSGMDYALMCRHNWIFGCDDCLWAGCFMSFANIFGKDYGDSRRFY